MSIHPLKQAGLFLSAIAFLGGIEIAAYAESPHSGQTLKALQDPQSIATPDEVILEANEERDIETGYEFPGLGAHCEILRPQYLLSFLGLEKYRYNSSLVPLSHNSRAPPVS